MTGIRTCLGLMGGLNQDQIDPPAAPANAPSAFNGVLRAKAPLGFDSTPSLDSRNRKDKKLFQSHIKKI